MMRCRACPGSSAGPTWPARTARFVRALSTRAARPDSEAGAWTAPGARALAMVALAALIQATPTQATLTQATPARTSRTWKAPTRVAAAPSPPARQLNLTFRAPVSYRSWKLEADSSSTTVSQLHLPFTASIGMGKNFDLVISGGMGLSSLEPDSGRLLSLDGPTDVIAQAFLRGAGNRLLLQAGVNLPTGKRDLQADQLTVSRALAHPLLAFRLKQYGQGTDVNAGLAFALPLASGVTFGVGAGRIFRGAYPLGDDMADFEPSAETAISTGLDVGRDDGTGPSARLDAVHRLYGTDRQGGISVFEPGNQTELQLAVRSGRSDNVGSQGVRVDVTGRLVWKANDQFLSATTPGEPQATRPGTFSRFTAAASFPLGSHLRAGLNTEWSGFTGGDMAGSKGSVSGTDGPIYGINGSVYGGGPELRIGLGRSGAFTMGGSYLLGTLDAKEAADRTDLSGFSAFCSLAWRTGP